MFYFVLGYYHVVAKLIRHRYGIQWHCDTHINNLTYYIENNKSRSKSGISKISLIFDIVTLLISLFQRRKNLKSRLKNSSLTLALIEFDLCGCWIPLFLCRSSFVNLFLVFILNMTDHGYQYQPKSNIPYDKLWVSDVTLLHDT